MSVYVEPRRPRPWGAIYTPEPPPQPPQKEPEMTMPDFREIPRDQLVAGLEAIHGYLVANATRLGTPEGFLPTSGSFAQRVDGLVAYGLSEFCGAFQAEGPLPGDGAGYQARRQRAQDHAVAVIEREWRARQPGTGGGTGGGGVPPSTLVPLSIQGTTFRRPDGTIWKYRMVTAFTAFQDFLAGHMSKLDAYAAWTRAVGGNGWRVFYTWSVTDFNPMRLGLAVLDGELADFRRYMDTQGLYSHNTVLCDQVHGSSVAMSPSEQDMLVAYVTDAMQGRIVEAVNEAYKNGGYGLSGRFVAEAFAGTFGTRSSHQDGERPDAPGSLLACTSEHTPRDAEWPRKAKNLLETSVQGMSAVGWAPSGKPAIAGEPIGIFETDIPGARTANASDVADYFALAELFGVGACLHGDGSTLQRCQLPGPTAQRCAEWAQAAREAIPAEAQLGHYTRGGLDDCPLEHSDSTALRTFAMLQGDVATAVVVRPVPGWEPKARNGWRIHSVGGPNGHIVRLVR